jgi:cyclohexyl-isocyanide hydratase
MEQSLTIEIASFVAVAKLAQLAVEYDPHPPFQAGSPEAAGPEAVQGVFEWMAPVMGDMLRGCERASQAVS